MPTIRKNIMLGTAGHVDHGKSALVKLLTGCETDTLAEEKERGLTIDLGFARCRLSDERIVGVIDVPGHVDFIRNMVAGAHGIDVVMFVVAADDGIMPQTVEHLRILSLMGIEHGIVALTKVDRVPKARLEEVTKALRQLLAGTFLASAPICPVSSITGEGFDCFYDALNAAARLCEERKSDGPFRMWVEDVFTLRGPGTVITGIPTSGSVQVGDTIELTPAGIFGRVRSLQVYGETSQAGRAGECIALNVPELAHEKARRGMVLGIGNSYPAVEMAEAELVLLETFEGELDDLQEAHVHIGTASLMCRVALLDRLSSKEPRMVQLRFAEPLPVMPGERFVLRANLGRGQSGLATIGGGCVLATTNVRFRRNKRWTLEMLAERKVALGAPERWCELMLQESSGPLGLKQLEQKCLATPAGLTAILERLEAGGKVIRMPGGQFAHLRLVESVARRMIAALEAFQFSHPERGGMSAEGLQTAAGSPVFFSLALQFLLTRNAVCLKGASYALQGWTPKVPDRDQILADRVVAEYLAAGFAGPAPAELAERLRAPLPQVQRVLAVLVDRALLVRLDEKTFIHDQAFESAKDIVLRLFKGRGSFSTMDFRDAVGVSRKYAVPLLDHLDRLRFTTRSGHDRRPGAEAKKRLGL